MEIERTPVRPNAVQHGTSAVVHSCCDSFHSADNVLSHMLDLGSDISNGLGGAFHEMRGRLRLDEAFMRRGWNGAESLQGLRIVFSSCVRS